jgi:hypothetical protein
MAFFYLKTVFDLIDLIEILSISGKLQNKSSDKKEEILELHYIQE